MHDLKSPVDYLVTGAWSEKAVAEAKRLGASVNVVLNTESTGHDGTFSLNNVKFSPNAQFIYFCDNETIHGVEFTNEMTLQLSRLGIPIVCDMSSNILSKTIDVSQFGCIFAGMMTCITLD